jgi:hypothetical protein
LAVYIAPLILAVAAISRGLSEGSIENLVQILRYIWDHGIFGKIVISIIFLYLCSALISTIEVYCASISNTIVDVILISGLNDVTSLRIAQFITFVVCTSFVPALLIVPDFTSLFFFMFFSANGLAGPLLGLVLGWRLSAVGVGLCMVIGFSYPLLSSATPALAEAILLPGFATTFVSCGITAFFHLLARKA